MFEKQSQILNSLTNKLNERDEVNQHLNEELYAYDQITKEREELIELKNNRIRQLESLLMKNNISVPKESETMMSLQKHSTVGSSNADGVELEGEITYSITEKNMKRSEQ